MVSVGPQSTEHPHVVKTPGTCGGRARIDGSRIPVWQVAEAIVRGGLSAEEFVEAHPQLTLAQVYDALSFYYDHRGKVQTDLRAQAAAWPKAKRKSR
jgi:uncharacterized protein (DUF433 family)